MKLNRTFGLSLLGASLALAGCSVWDPYVRAPELVDYKYAGTVSLLYGDLPAAIDAAQAQRNAYAKAAGEQSEFRNALALIGVPAAGAATFLGITSTSGASRDFIAGTAIGLAALFGVGDYFYSGPRRRVYLEGSHTDTTAAKRWAKE